ncbi:dTDP-4-dehydrorhamnose reductase [Inhella gelatinilytica]|uniref:dTDP-4-dehydrorhamnose reductase n=1 Tax=Inhella gelatinilytica TaxID=2795030 RepID=A0A931IZ89_9BURK|nr:dTDP-4-dehydrorhamnose reductase [Inhella gelatinilytica]MBH9552526.1 dTDP-4-dehydrorhamnose reductase [Inhella gelatinilytica]
MKILLLGANGQVGWELQRALAPLGELHAWNRELGDLAQPDALLSRLQALAPRVIVNAAAYTAVDKAESDANLARQINAETPGRLAQWAAHTGAALLHYSTDYVFDGSGCAPRDETAATGPLSVYGRTKLAGEDAIRASGCAHLILRTSWVYAARGGNFAKTMLRLAAERPALRVVNDQVGAPTGAELLADCAAHALRSLLLRPEVGGTYHCCAAGETNWAEYARWVIDLAKAQGQALQCSEVQGIPSAEYPTPAPRPLNSRLDCRRFESTFGLRLPPWEQGVRRLLTEILT